MINRLLDITMAVGDPGGLADFWSAVAALPVTTSLEPRNDQASFALRRATTGTSQACTSVAKPRPT